MSLAETIAAIASCGSDWTRVRGLVETAIESGRFSQRQLDRILAALPQPVAPPPKQSAPKPVAPAAPKPERSRTRFWRAA
jgi:hypothetical protein